MVKGYKYIIYIWKSVSKLYILISFWKDIYNSKKLEINKMFNINYIVLI